MTNPLCPDHHSHFMNVVDVMFPAGAPDTLTPEQAEQVDAAAEAEYLACEGH